MSAVFDLSLLGGMGDAGTGWSTAVDGIDGRGLTLVHFSAQPIPSLLTETLQSPDVSRKRCSRQAENWTIARGFHSSTCQLDLSRFGH